MGFFKDLKSRVRGMQNQMQGPMMRGGTSFGPPSFQDIIRNQAPGTVLDLETGLPPVRPPLSNLKNIGNNRIQDDFNMVENSTFTDPRDMPGFDYRYMPDERAFLPDTSVNPPGNFLRRPRRLPQIMPERRMPQQGPSNRFFGGGLGSIFSRLPDQRVREGMSPPLPRAPLPMPQDMPRERFPMMRPGFAEGGASDTTNESITTFLRKYTITPHLMDQRFFQEPSFDKWVNAARSQNKAGNPIPYVAPFMSDSIDALKVGYDSFLKEFKEKRSQNKNGGEINSNILIAEQGAREGISPPEMAAQRMREFLGETGRTVSDRDIELFSVGMLNLEDIIDRAEPVTNRNLEQQEQMFFPQSESLDDMLADLEKKN